MKLKYVVVYEQTNNNYSAYPPDLPGCISTGKSWTDIQEMIREAITFHIESVLENGEPLPEPRMSVEEAMAYHCQNLEEFKETFGGFGDDNRPLSTTVEMVAVEVVLQPAKTVH